MAQFLNLFSLFRWMYLDPYVNQVRAWMLTSRTSNLPEPCWVRYYGIPTLPAIAMFTADSKADTERPLSTPMTNENAPQTS